MDNHFSPFFKNNEDLIVPIESVPNLGVVYFCLNILSFFHRD